MVNAYKSLNHKNVSKISRTSGEELADVLIYLVRLADRCEIDLAKAVEDKMQKNERKYPAVRQTNNFFHMRYFILVHATSTVHVRPMNNSVVTCYLVGHRKGILQEVFRI